MKCPKTISLNKDIIEDIKNRSQKYSFNFSEWVEGKYFEEFMSIHSKQNEIDRLNIEMTQIQDKISNLINSIKQSKKYEEISRKILNTTEKRFLLNVPIMIKSGSSWDGLCCTFNRIHQKDFNIDEFKKLVEVINNASKK
jgi:hypothetical protein